MAMRMITQNQAIPINKTSFGGLPAQISTNRVLGTLPVVPVFAPICGCSCCMQPAAMTVKAIAAITTSDFMISPDGKTYQGIS